MELRECLIAPISNGDDPLFPALPAAAQAMILSLKGKKKSSEELLLELRSVIKQYKCTLTETIDLNLVDVSTDPSLLLDCHIKQMAK